MIKLGLLNLSHTHIDTAFPPMNTLHNDIVEFLGICLASILQPELVVRPESGHWCPHNENHSGTREHVGYFVGGEYTGFGEACGNVSLNDVTFGICMR